MGLLQDGQWVDQWYDTKSSGGRFVRKDSEFRNWVTADGSAGPSGTGGFKAEAGRYHLYVSLACPWAHRTLIFRALKGLEDMIDVSVVNWFMARMVGRLPPATAPRRTLFMVRIICTRSTPRPTQTTRVASPCLCYGTRHKAPSCPTKAPRSSGC